MSTRKYIVITRTARENGREWWDSFVCLEDKSTGCYFTNSSLMGNWSSSTCHFWDWRSRRLRLIPSVYPTKYIYQYHTLGSSAQILEWRGPSTYNFFSLDMQVFLRFFKVQQQQETWPDLTSHWHPKSSSLVEGRSFTWTPFLVWTQELLWSQLPSSQKESDTSESSSLALRLPSTFQPPKQGQGTHMQLQLYKLSLLSSQYVQIQTLAFWLMLVNLVKETSLNFICYIESHITEHVLVIE